MSANPEQRVLDAIDELEALESPDEIDERVRWQLEDGLRRGEVGPEAASLSEILAAVDTLRETVRQLRPRTSVEVPALMPGDRVGWQCGDGTVRVDVVPGETVTNPEQRGYTLADLQMWMSSR